jgi:hypothetical protein
MLELRINYGRYFNSAPTVTKIMWMDLSHRKESQLFKLGVRNIFSLEFEYRVKSSWSGHVNS